MDGRARSWLACRVVPWRGHPDSSHCVGCCSALPGRQIKLKDLIIKNFVSQEQGAEMHAKAVWDDDIGDWIVGAETTIDLYSYKRPSVRSSDDTERDLPTTLA